MIEADTEAPPLIEDPEPQDSAKPWRCRVCGGVLGFVVHRRDATTLHIYRETAYPPFAKSPEVVTETIYTSAVYCRCGARRVFYAAKAVAEARCA